MTVEEAVAFFQNVPYLYRKIKVLEECGVGLYHPGSIRSNTERGRSTKSEAIHRNFPKKIPAKLFIYWMNQLPDYILRYISTCWMCLNKLVDRGNTYW
jgi:excinuclease ABC subunit A